MFVRPPDLPQSEDVDEQRKYRRALSSYNYRMAVCVYSLAIGAAWAVTPYGFVKAETLEKRIAEVVSPVKDEQKELKLALADLKVIQTRDSSRLSTSLSNGIASEIRYLLAKRCKETNAFERDTLWREIERKQDEYKELRGEKYALMTCAEL